MNPAEDTLTAAIIAAFDEYARATKAGRSGVTDKEIADISRAVSAITYRIEQAAE